MKLKIQYNGKERVSFLNLLSALSYYDKKMSLEEMSQILKNRADSADFIYKVNHTEKINEIVSMLESYNVTYSIINPKA